MPHWTSQKLIIGIWLLSILTALTLIGVSADARTFREPETARSHPMTAVRMDQKFDLLDAVEKVRDMAPAAYPPPVHVDIPYKFVDEELAIKRYYESCTEDNGYLTGDIMKALDSSFYKAHFKHFKSEHEKPLIKPICVASAMKKFFNPLEVKNRRYRDCQMTSNYEQKKVTAVVRPCVQEAYVELTTSSLNVVAECLAPYLLIDDYYYNLNKNPRVLRDSAHTVLGLLMHESGYHSNPVSSTGAGGVGQLIDKAIDHINKYEYKNLRAYVSTHPNVSCRFINDLLDSPMESQKVCERLSIQKDNPVKNLIYSFAYQKVIREDIYDSLMANEKYKPIWAGMDIVTKQYLVNSLAIIAYNTGSTGLLETAYSLLNWNYMKPEGKTMVVSRTITTADDMKQFIKNINQHFRIFNSRIKKKSDRKSKKRIHEMSAYYDSVAKRYSDIQKDTGVQCINH